MTALVLQARSTCQGFIGVLVNIFLRISIQPFLIVGNLHGNYYYRSLYTTTLCNHNHSTRPLFLSFRFLRPAQPSLRLLCFSVRSKCKSTPSQKCTWRTRNDISDWNIRKGELKPMDVEQLREYGHKMVDFIADYYKSLETFPVLSQVEVCVYHLSHSFPRLFLSSLIVG